LFVISVTNDSVESQLNLTLFNRTGDVISKKRNGGGANEDKISDLMSILLFFKSMFGIFELISCRFKKSSL
jgi:hypothetical protein